MTYSKSIRKSKFSYKIFSTIPQSEIEMPRVSGINADLLISFCLATKSAAIQPNWAERASLCLQYQYWNSLSSSSHFFCPFLWHCFVVNISPMDFLLPLKKLQKQKRDSEIWLERKCRTGKPGKIAKKFMEYFGNTLLTARRTLQIWSKY